MTPQINYDSIENDFVRFGVDVTENAWQLVDKRAGVSWGGKGSWVSLAAGGQRQPLTLSQVQITEGALAVRFAKPAGADAPLTLTVRLDGPAVLGYVDTGRENCSLVELFGAGLAGDEAILPLRMGLLIPAQGAEAFDKRFGTYEYEGLHMAMAGLFKDGAALMLAWHDPYTALHLARRLEPRPRLEMRLELPKTARSFELTCLGRGDYHAVADAYRARAARLGYRIPWSEKLKDRPQAARLFGAGNFKLWTALARRVDENRVEKSVEVCWTFDEVAQIAEHLKHDLKLDEILFHLGGWSTYGYDCRHPDVMPANPECGGDAGLADCAARVQACGYLFCLHDNYQDMYRDAPSWDEFYIQKRPDGSLYKGGVWLGGQAYYTCSQAVVPLAQRPQNLPQVKAVSGADAYFIDTTYAVGPQECYDPRHPLTFQQDIQWKQALSDYARQVFGLFGSECGREWAVPHADFFEGLASVSGHYYHLLDPETLGGRVVPLFDMVFHDCIAIHGKYGYEPAQMAEQVIHHAAIGRTLYYHSVPDHLYWQAPGGLDEAPLPDGPADPALYTRAHNGWAEGFCLWDRYIKNTQEILGPLYRCTAQAWIERYEFLDDARRVRRTVFSNGVRVLVNGSLVDVTLTSEQWGEVILPSFGLLVEADDFTAVVAKAWNGKRYAAPVLFTLTSQDGKPLSQSGQVRVFHGFGEDVLRWRGREARIPKEGIV